MQAPGQAAVQSRGGGQDADILRDVAVVAIGRNEGERLRACLESVVMRVGLTVYVDSGSSDDSVEMAKSLGVEVVALDTTIPFTAARARNAGYRRALEQRPDLEWVQFVDGDCEVQASWLRMARDYLAEHAEAAVVAGRRRERYPTSTVYNELCDIEWEVQPGTADACGGDAMFRIAAFSEVDGYRDTLIAGEEPELCVRLRQRGWQIHLVDAEMTLHDANMTSFLQWWRRMKRSGWAFAAGAHLHGGPPEYHWVWPAAQAWIWVVVPLLTMLLALPFVGAWAVCVLGVYPAQCFRLYLKLGGTRRRRLLQAVSITLGRFAELSGQIRYLLDVASGRSARLIEYK